jgi:Zn-finger protein
MVKQNKNKQMKTNLEKLKADTNLFNYHFLGSFNNIKFKEYFEINTELFRDLDLLYIHEKQFGGDVCLCNQRIKKHFYIIDKKILNNRFITNTYSINDYVYIIGKDCLFKFIDIRKDSNGKILYMRCSCGNWHNNKKSKKCNDCMIIHNSIKQHKLIAKKILDNHNKQKKIKYNKKKAESLKYYFYIEIFKNDRIIIEFGKYKGFSLKRILKNHFDYIKYIYSIDYYPGVLGISDEFYLNKAYDIIIMLKKIELALNYLSDNGFIKFNSISYLINN